MIPALAEFVEIPTAATLVSGTDARQHLNRIVTVDMQQDQFLSRRHSLICDLNGRISSFQLHADLGEQILLLHNESVSNILRDNLTTGIPWNENVDVSSGDGAVHRLVLYGAHPERVILGLGINVKEIRKEAWTEFLDSMISILQSGNEHTIFEMLIPTRNIKQITEALSINGAQEGNLHSCIALQSIEGNIDTSIEIAGHIPFNIGLTELVDLKKGCYPGQEIHARIESRGAINKSISAFRSSTLIPLGKQTAKQDIPLEVISSEQLGDSWINLIVHPRDLETGSEFALITSEGEFNFHHV